jgi:hypothetical protein
MRYSPLLIVSCLALMVIAMPRAHAFTSQPDSAAAVTGGAPLADPDDKMKTMFGGGGASGSGGSGATIGTQGSFQPGSVPGFGSGGYGATYDRSSGKGD